MLAILCLIIVPLGAWGHENTVMPDTIFYSEFCYSLAEIDSLLLFSPQLILLSEQIKTRNQKDSFLRSLSIHLTYSPFDEPIPETKRAWLGFSFPVGKLFQNTKTLDEVEINALLLTLKVQARQLMKQHEQFLFELQLEIQKHQTVLLKLQKMEIALSIDQASSDEVLQAKDQLAEQQAQIKKIKLEIHFIKEQLKALIGEL